MKNLFKSYPTQSHLIPLNPTIISSLLYIYIIRYQFGLFRKLLNYSDIVIKLALPPAAAVFTLIARSITKRSSGIDSFGST